MNNQISILGLHTLKKMSVYFFACLLGLVATAQEITVTGTVSDKTGPLPGVSVLVAGTSNGVATDFDGNYSLNNVPADGVLIFSSLGYLTQEVQVQNQSTISITLLENLEEMDEVIVVAYGNQSREEVTGAISTVDSEEITATPVATADQALQGRAAGVSVINNGSPGVAPTVKIRGVSSPTGQGPLYVIDGVISTGLGNLNPNDIESINVLKDASTAAAYGSQASNGVVIVTTKRGRPGKVQVSFNSYTGVQYTTERYDLLNNDQYLQFSQDAFGFTPTSPLSSSGLNTDWQDAIFQQGIIQNHDLAVAGGGENSDFRISGSFLDQEGTIIETGFTRYNFRANSNFTIGKFRLGEALSVSFSEINPERQDGGRSLIEHAIKSAPYLPIYNPDNLGGFQGPNSALDGQDARNPVAAQSLGYVENNTTDIFGNIYGEFDIIDGLTFRMQLGIKNTTTRFNSFIPQPSQTDMELLNNSFKELMIQHDLKTKEIFDKYPAYAPITRLPAPNFWEPLPEGDLPSTEQLLNAGWGYVTLDTGSIQADNVAGLTSGIIGLTNKGQYREPDQWGALRAWAWGASRVLDYLETDALVDETKVGIEGVSRYGKAAMVAMAFDQRFAVGLIGSSGKGGVTLHRRSFGETVENLAGQGASHWMAGNYMKYAAEKSKSGRMTGCDLPVDSHQLVAMAAPRPTFISYGIPEKGDANWLDQKGSYMATVAAGKVYEFLGAKDIGVSNDYMTEEMPAHNTSMLNGQLAWRQHDGGHTDWPNMKYFIPWANEMLKYEKKTE